MVLTLFFGMVFSTVSAAVDPSTPPDYVSQWGSQGAGDGQFEFGGEDVFGMATDSFGNIYVADTSNHRIQKFDANGTFLTKWGSYGSGNGQLKSPNGIAIDSSDNIYVTEASVNNRVQKFDTSGNYLTKWGSGGTGNGQFSYPRGIAIDSSDNVYVADANNGRIQKFSSTGTFLSKFGSSGTGNGQFLYPFGLAIDSSDNMYVADNSNHRVQKFDSSGVYLTQWGSYGSGNSQFNYPFDVAIDSSNSVYVADTYNSRIQKFDSSGTYLSQWGSLGSENGQFGAPFGIVVDASDNVYVADAGNNRIQKFTYPEQESLTNPSGGDISLSTPGGTTLTSNTVVTEASLTSQDGRVSYPLGLIDFSLTVPAAGDATTVSLTFETDLTPSDVTARKYNTGTDIYADVPGASITETTLNGNHALLLTYDITDGGDLDSDGLANGTILDPVGLAVANTATTTGTTSDTDADNTLADTGESSRTVVIFAEALFFVAAIVFALRRRIN